MVGAEQSVQRFRPRWVGALAFLLAAILAAIGWWFEGQPVAGIPDAPTAKLRCVSYAPFQGWQTPADPELMIPSAQMEADLRYLAERFDCVRTYSTAHGQDAIPRLAQKLGIKVIVGAWIGREADRNARELQEVIELANAYPDTVRALVIGNETLLRQEQPPEALAAMMNQARQATKVPVTYADVWEFWLRNPQLAEAADFVTIHILPYWEDDPIGIDHAVDHIANILGIVQAKFPNKKLLIGETGWPSEGRMREAARPSPANQARFIRGFVNLAEAKGIDYNVIEAFDQSWKRAQEGTVGGYWGLYDTARQAKFPFIGPAGGDAFWRERLAASLALAALPVLYALSRGRRFSTAEWLAFAFAAMAAGCIVVVQARFVAITSVTPRDWGFGIAGIALSLATAWTLLRHAARGALFWPYAGDGYRAAPLRDVLAWPRGFWAAPFTPSLWLGVLHGASVFAATAIALALVFDPRYRDFPTVAFLIPAVGFLAAGGRLAPGRTEERWLAWLLATAALVGGVREGFENWQAWGWTVTCLVLAWPWLGLRKRA